MARILRTRDGIISFGTYWTARNFSFERSHRSWSVSHLPHSIFLNFILNFRSTWKQIIRKDGRDLWKSSESGEHDGIRKRKLTTSKEVGLLGDCPFDEPPSKVRRNSGTSQLSYPSVKSEEFTPIATSSVVPIEKDSSDLSLPSLVAMALTSAKEIENGHPMSFSSDVLRNCLTESIELVSILGKINRDHVTDQK